jgi:outer membrane protein assembly factor BamD
MKNRLLFILASALLLSLSSCKFQKLVKSGSVDEKYEMAVKLYNEKDYSRALQLFDQLVGAMRATDKSERIYYFYAYCYFNQRDYTLASYYFKRYTSNFPNTPNTEECQFMSAYCNYLSSPEYSLDQTVTYDALKEFQLFANMYPTSKRVSECNDLIDKLREKLEMKDYKVAKMYYRMDDYSAAVKSFSNILKEYPDTKHKEEIMYLIFKAYHKFAKQSVLMKKQERHIKAIVAYNEFIAQYPQSQWVEEAKSLKESTQQELDSMFLKDEKAIKKATENNQTIKTKK